MEGDQQIELAVAVEIRDLNFNRPVSSACDYSGKTEVSVALADKDGQGTVVIGDNQVKVAVAIKVADRNVAGSWPRLMVAALEFWVNPAEIASNKKAAKTAAW